MSDPQDQALHQFMIGQERRPVLVTTHRQWVPVVVKLSSLALSSAERMEAFYYPNLMQLSRGKIRIADTPGEEKKIVFSTDLGAVASEMRHFFGCFCSLFSQWGNGPARSSQHSHSSVRTDRGGRCAKPARARHALCSLTVEIQRCRGKSCASTSGSGAGN